MAALGEQFSEREIVELILIVGRWRTIAMLVNALDVEPEPEQGDAVLAWLGWLPQVTAMTESFVHDSTAARIVFGAGRIAAAPAEIARVGARPLVISDPAFAAAADQIVAGLDGAAAGTISAVRPHVPVEVAERARAAAREAEADLVLSIGGGSTTGTAKAIALDLGTPIAAVPTTYAGSEVTPVWGLTEGAVKITGRSPAVLPKLVVYDPELTVSLPPGVTGPSGLNAMAHCVEVFYAPGVNPITSLLAAEGIRVLAAGLPAAVDDPDDLEARDLALFGAYLAGSAFAVAGSGLHHKICHALGGAFDLPHAETHAIVLPHVLAFNEPGMPEAAARIRAALGTERESAARAVFELLEAVGAPRSLAAIGMPADGAVPVVDQIVAAVPPGNPRPVDRRLGGGDPRRRLRRGGSGVRPYLVGLGGTTDPSSSSERALVAALAAARDQGADTRLLTARELELPMYAPGNSERSAAARDFLAEIERCDGVFISTPAYHGSVSGLLKNAIDYLEDLREAERPYLDGRPVGCIVCAYGWQGTGTALAALRGIVHALRGWPTPLGVTINSSEEVFDADGRVVIPRSRRACACWPTR